MAVVYMLAGPNGAGKTSFYLKAITEKFIPADLPFINVDNIARSLGGYTEKNYAAAPEIYRTIIKEHLDNKADFLIESNLAESRNYDWIALMKKSGYEAILYYLSTDDVEINIRRVRSRVAEGGHDIPEAIIRSRYNQSHSYLKTKLREFKEVYLIDNSADVSTVYARLADGEIIFTMTPGIDWVNDVLSITERIQRKYKRS